MPPRVVAWRLADRGFTGVGRPRFDGRVYVVDAVSPTGVPVRLLVDPGMGAIVGRQRLGAPETYARLERPAPGFGWTEEEAGPRGVARPLSPENNPAPRPQRRPAGEALRPEPNPDGVNPDNIGRSAPPRKTVRANPVRPLEKPAHRVSPEAPAPKLAPAESAKTEPGTDAKPETKSAAIDKAAPATPAPAAAAKTSESTLAAASKPPAQDWKDPPPDKKPVRVIGGATIVPGTAEKEQGAAQ
ncbi:hypothetical protein [Methylobacterium sp. PvR107]|uniref:hypothetical protein n=1 Tax=Methylobacterium sp. PvR107 TaxID=2806597 RepID=UPI001B7AEFED|nr:hypothetical protein [Methylobacterium sp. PvR107]MBP1182693.1 hypothetical protein [Methylobacterium sp. PvR107]